MKRYIALLMSLIMILGLFSGCKNDPDAYKPTGDALVMDDGTTTEVVQEEEQEQELTLTYYPNVTLNPLLCNDFTNRVLFSLTHQGLFAVDRDYNPTPILCKNYSYSEDMRVYTFYLEDATFSDGTKVTPADVVATYQAAMESDYYRGRFFHITEVALSSDGGVNITLDTPMEDLPILLDIPILKASQITIDNPVGSGPYYLDTSSDSGILRRCENWWSNETILVTAPAIALVKAESNPQIRDEFEFFDLNLVCANPGSDKYADYRCDYELWDCENGGFLYLMCNMNSEIFKEESIRSQLTYLIDRETIAAENYRGFGMPASLPASPVSPYYSTVQAETYAYNGGESFKQAVLSAGLAGKELILLVNSEDTMRERIARFIGKALTDAGFVVNVYGCAGSDYEYALNAGMYDLYLGQTRLSPNMDLSSFFNVYGKLSWGSINDAGLYALCLEALANEGNYYTLHQTVMDDGRLVPILFTGYAIYATRGLMPNLTPSRDNVFFYHLGKTMDDVVIKP